jgi:integrase
MARAQALRTAAVVWLLLHNALRVDEACTADVADLGEDGGHRVLRVVRKGARKAKMPLTPAAVAALDAYLADRAARAGVGEWRQLGGPLLATANGGRLRQGHPWELVRPLLTNPVRPSVPSSSLLADAAMSLLRYRPALWYRTAKAPTDANARSPSPATAWAIAQSVDRRSAPVARLDKEKTAAPPTTWAATPVREAGR